jgi:NADPH:quinone reductase-like Zn-dependent oxidoreductase
MIAMGVVPAAKDNLGTEASGIITRDGEGVENFAAGDSCRDVPWDTCHPHSG